MLVVTARLFKDNQLVGYQLSDGQSTQDCTKQQAWYYAKNKQILNVVATGNEANPGLSGTNGFELKKIPEIKWKEPEVSSKFDVQDLLAAFLYRTVSSNETLLKKLENIDSFDEYKRRLSEMQKQAIKDRVNQEGLKERRIWSDSASVENGLYVGGHLVGYTIKNNANYSIGIYKIPIGQVQKRQLVELKPNESIEVSKAEIALTLSQIQFSGKIGNYKLVAASKSNRSMSVYEWLNRYYIMGTGDLASKSLIVNEYTKNYIITPKQLEAYIDGKTLDTCVITEIADMADRYDIDSSNIRNAAKVVQEAQKNQVANTIEALNNTKTNKGIFNMFKR